MPPIRCETASSIPSRDNAKVSTSLSLTVRVISLPFNRLHRIRHFASLGQSVSIVSPEGAQTENLQWLSGKSCVSSPLKVYAWLKTPGKMKSLEGWKITELKQETDWPKKSWSVLKAVSSNQTRFSLITGRFHNRLPVWSDHNWIVPSRHSQTM